jgi:hypothetical protein
MTFREHSCHKKHLVNTTSRIDIERTRHLEETSRELNLQKKSQGKQPAQKRIDNRTYKING